MRVQIACAPQQHIVWVNLADGLAQPEWDAILAAVASHGCPRCAGTWTLPTAPTVDASEWDEEIDEILQIHAHADGKHELTREDDCPICCEELQATDEAALPICPCPCHSNGVVRHSECLCIPECVRGEARALDFTDRDAMVAWLIENDKNGAHADEDAMAELGHVHTLESAIRCYVGVMDLDDQQA